MESVLQDLLDKYRGDWGAVDEIIRLKAFIVECAHVTDIYLSSP